jgi:hypothetical protein
MNNSVWNANTLPSERLWRVEVPNFVTSGPNNVTVSIETVDSRFQADCQESALQQTQESRLAVNNDQQQLPSPPHVYTRRPRETTALSSSKGKKKEAFSHLFIQA